MFSRTVEKTPDDLSPVVNALCMRTKRAGHIDHDEAPAGVKEPVRASAVKEKSYNLAFAIDAKCLR